MENSTHHDYDKINKLLDEAIELHENDKLDDALKLFEKIISEYGDFAECYNSIGDIFLKKGKFEEALKNYEKAYSIKPDFEDYLFDYAIALLYTGKTEKAKKFLLKCIEMEPSHTQIFPLLGRIEVELGNFVGSLDLLRKAIINDKSNLVARFYLAIALYKLNRLDEAKSEFETVIDRLKSSLTVYPNNPEGYYFLGLANAYLENYEEAELNLKRAIELDTPELDYHYKEGLTYHDFDAFIAHAEVLLKLGKKEEAKADVERALEIFPDDKKAQKLLEELS